MDHVYLKATNVTSCIFERAHSFGFFPHAHVKKVDSEINPEKRKVYG